MMKTPRRSSALTAAFVVMGLAQPVVAATPHNNRPQPLQRPSATLQIPEEAKIPQPHVPTGEKADAVDIGNGVLFGPSDILKNLKKGQEGR